MAAPADRAAASRNLDAPDGGPREHSPAHWPRDAHPDAPSTDQLATFLAGTSIGAYEHYERLLPAVHASSHSDELVPRHERALQHLAAAAETGRECLAGTISAEPACESMLDQLSRAFMAGIPWHMSRCAAAWIGTTVSVIDGETAASAATWVAAAVSQYRSSPAEAAVYTGCDLAYVQPWWSREAPLRQEPAAAHEVLLDLVDASDAGLPPDALDELSRLPDGELERRVCARQGIPPAEIRQWIRERRASERAPSTTAARRAVWVEMDRAIARRRDVSAVHERRTRARGRERHAGARRRTGASSSSSSSDPGDPDPEGPPPPRLMLRPHPAYGACTPSLLRVLTNARAVKA